jgi:hypothetical protein
MLGLQSAYAHASRIQALAEHQKADSNSSSEDMGRETKKTSASGVLRQQVSHRDRSTVMFLDTLELEIFLQQEDSWSSCLDGPTGKYKLLSWLYDGG